MPSGKPNGQRLNERKERIVKAKDLRSRSECEENAEPNVTEKNYYAEDTNNAFFSVSQFKDFLKCEAMAMAKIHGEWNPEKTEALYLGSFVDEMLTGTEESLEAFSTENHDVIYQKSGKMREAFARAVETVERIRNTQPLMMYLLSGEHQRIMTGEIEGVPFKIKMDSYKPGEYIADLKYMRSLRSPNLFENIITYWGYDLQAAAYQEIVYQNTGERLPFYFVVATKETPAHLEVGAISQENMDNALKTIKANIQRFQRIKNGEIPPERCEDYGCDYCTTTKIVTDPIDTDEFGLSAKQKKGMRGIG